MCKRILVYEVIDSFVVEPEEVLKLEIEKNQDLLSLVTCTPYGINTKRLVVQAKRVHEKQQKRVRKSYSLREVSFVAFPFVLWIVFKVVRK